MVRLTKRPRLSIRTVAGLGTALFGLTFYSHLCAAQPLLLEFGSKSCGPCQEMQPVIQRLKSQGYRVHTIDIGREPEHAAHYRIDRVPAYVVLVNGRESSRWTGLGSYEKLEQMLHHAAREPSETANLRGQSPDGYQQAPPNQPASYQSDPNANISLVSSQSAPSPAGNAVPSHATAGQSMGYNGGQAASPTGSFAAAPPTNSPSIDPNRLIEATVKLSVEDGDGTSSGTGTIVDAREGAALVLTCGHIFRNSEGKGPVSVKLFNATPDGAQLRETLEGQVMHYDLERDLALVVLRPNGPVQSIPIAPANTQLVPQSSVVTVGCNNGANPTAIQSHITTVDRYKGPPNVQVAGAPVEGRSGGGLFNAAGQLIGVCFAADPQSNEGLYASLPSIHEKLDSMNLSVVYQSPSVSGPAEPRFAEQPPQPVNPGPQTSPAQEVRPPSNPEFAIRGQDPFPATDGFAAPGSQGDSPNWSPTEQAALEELGRRGVNSEIVCIIRPHDPQGKSEVITLNGMSPEFVEALSRVSGTTQPQTARTAAGQLLR